MEAAETIDYKEAEKHRLPLETNIYSQSPLNFLVENIISGLPEEVRFDDNNLLRVISNLLRIVLGLGDNVPDIRIRKFRGLEKEQRAAEYKKIAASYRKTIKEYLVQFESSGYYKKLKSIEITEHEQRITTFIDLVIAELGKMEAVDDIIVLAYLRSCKDDARYGTDGLPMKNIKSGALEFNQYKQEFLLTAKYQADYVPVIAPDPVVGVPVLDTTMHFIRDRYGKRHRKRR